MNEARNNRDRRICKCVGLLFCILNSTLCYSQENPKGEVYQYARKIVDTLASPSMHGRGYVNGGDSIAALYIANEFQKYGLKSFEKIDDKHPKDNFYQRFSLSVNTFPGRMSLESPAKKYQRMEDGLDFPMSGFRPDPACPSVKGNFNIIKIDSSSVKNVADLKNLYSKTYRNDFLLIDTIGIKNVEQKKLFESFFHEIPKGVKGVLFYRKKTQRDTSRIFRIDAWDLSQHQAKYPIIEIVSPTGLFGSVKINIKSKFIPQYQTQNIVGYIKGSAYPDSFIVYTAHYDHLGEIGENSWIDPFYFPGANDNASGCAMLLNLAKYYSAHPPKYSIAFMAFGAEEAGLVGSKFYTEHPLFPLKQIKFLINFDIMGTGDEGIKVVNATEFKTEFNTLVKLNAQGSYVKEVSPRGKASISDHYFFTQNGVKCFYIYTLGGIKAYHDIYDRAETLPLTKFEDVFNLMIDFGAWLQN